MLKIIYTKCKFKVTLTNKLTLVGAQYCSLATQASLPHLLYNHVPLPLPSLSPCSGNRVNPLGSTKCVWVRGEPTLKKETPLYPPITNTHPPPHPHLSYCHVSLTSPPFRPPPLKFRVIIIACVALNAPIYFSAHGSQH